MRRWIAACMVVGCQAAPPDETVETDDSAEVLEVTTYHRDVRPIFEKHCVSCHSPGQIGPFSMVFDADAWGEGAPSWSQAAVQSVQAGTMPPWMPADDCHPIAEARGLSDAAKDTVASWADEGFAMGEPADFVPRKTPEAVDLGEPTWVLRGETPYTPDVTKPDDYRCLVLDHDVDQDRWMKAFSAKPDQLDTVHHVILYRLDASWAEAVQGWDDADEGIGYSCFGSPGTWEADTIAGWTPGQVPEVYGEDEARRIAAGSVLVLQMHYNLLNLDGATPEPDHTAVELWMMPEGEQPRLELLSVPFPKTDIFLPAGQADVLEQEEVAPSMLLGPVQVRGIYPHMHQLGSSIRVDVVGSDGEEDCLIDVPQWDFNWQQSYLFDPGTSVSVTRDDKVRLSCRYDNSAANQPTVNGVQQAPVDVTWGDGSLDEMCLAYLYVTRPLLAD